MSLTTHSVRIAGKVYELTSEASHSDGYSGFVTVRCKQYPGIVSKDKEEGKAIDNVIKAIIDKISESQAKP